MSYSTWENCGLRHQTAEMPKRAIVKRTLMTHDGMSHHRLKLPPLPSLVDHIPAFLWHWCVRAPCLKWPQHIIKAGFHVMAFAKVAASFVERVLLMTCKVKSLLIRPSDFLEYTFGFHFRSCLRRSHRSLCICWHYQVKNAWRRIIAGWHKLCFCEQIIHFIYVSFDCDLRLYRCIVLFVRKSEPASCCLEVYLISQFFACIFFQAFAWLADFEFLRQRVPRRVIWLEVFSHLW